MYLCMQLENFEGFFILANFVYSYESKKNIGKEKATFTYYLGQKKVSTCKAVSIHVLFILSDMEYPSGYKFVDCTHAQLLLINLTS